MTYRQLLDAIEEGNERLSVFQDHYYNMPMKHCTAQENDDYDAKLLYLESQLDEEINFNNVPSHII